jgi:ABC-2 type transport system ATP-binding protein
MLIIAKHEEFFNGEILKKQKYLRDLSKETKESRYHRHIIGNPEVILDEPLQI